jgi:hypothetical protein
LTLRLAALVPRELAGLFALLALERLRRAERLSSGLRPLTAELRPLTAERRSRSSESAATTATSATASASVLIAEPVGRLRPSTSGLRGAGSRTARLRRVFVARLRRLLVVAAL